MDAVLVSGWEALCQLLAPAFTRPTFVTFLHLAAFAVVALNCHAQLAQDRPEPARLTEFYFWLSFGGMLGGLFNALVAPVLFDSIAEYPLVLVLACALWRGSDIAAASRR